MKHDIILKGYGAFLPTTPSKMLCLGTAESYGVEQLNIIPGAGWEGLVIKAIFHPASSEPVVVVVGENGGVIDVPPEATANATAESSPGVIVFSGVADGVQRISANLAYTVIGHAPVEGKDSAPTPSQWEQLAVQYQNKVDKQQGAENAGKVLGIGEDGLVMPVEQTGGSGGEKEIFWVDFDQTSRTASHSASEILEALKSGLLVLGRQGADISFVTGTTTSVVIFGQLFYSERNAGTAEAAPTIYYDQIVVKEDKSFYRNVFSVSQFDTLPNPFPLKFSGAVEGTYDGSAPKEIKIPEAKEYTLPAASESALGGVKAPAKTEDMTQPVGIGEDGFLFAKAGGSGEFTLIADVTTPEDLTLFEITVDNEGEPFCLSECMVLVDLHPALSEGSSAGLRCRLRVDGVGENVSPYPYGQVEMWPPQNEGEHSWKKAIFVVASDGFVFVDNNSQSYNASSLPNAMGYGNGLANMHWMPVNASGPDKRDYIESGIARIALGSYGVTIGANSRMIVYGVRK